VKFKKIKILIKSIILKHKYLYEIYFFITRKNINRNKIDKKIIKLCKFKNPPRVEGLIVSLTTYGERLKDVRYTLYSIQEQSILPEKVVLWLSYDDYRENQAYINKLQYLFSRANLEIIKTKDIFSYKKLIPALEKFPNYYILTADDDIYYRKNWLKKIWSEHQKNPKNVMCHIAHKISLNEQGIMPYNQWKSRIKNKMSSFLVFGCTGGGILYHKSYLYKDVLNENIFLKYAPTADDIWFYFMTIMNNRKYQVVKAPHNRLRCTDIYKEYGLNGKQTLVSQNVDQGKNDIQFAAIMNYYNLDITYIMQT
jgi:hypothetical protein